MSRNRNKTGSDAFSGVGRGSPLPSSAERLLDPGARLDEDIYSPLVHPAPAVQRRPRTVRSSIRTVLTDTNRPNRFPSPTVQSRASGRATVWFRQLPEPYSAAPKLPKRAIKCAKDAIRREVLFAGGVGGSKRKYPARKRPTKTNCR